MRRFLGGLPVTATRDTPAYLLRKFVSRFRWQVIAALLFLAAILGTLGASLIQAERIRRERDQTEIARQRAEQQARRAETSQKFLADLLDAADETERRQNDLSVRDLLEEALSRLEAGSVGLDESTADLAYLVSSAFGDFREQRLALRAMELAVETTDRQSDPQLYAERLGDLANLQGINRQFEQARNSCTLLFAGDLPRSQETVRSCFRVWQRVAYDDGDYRAAFEFFDRETITLTYQDLPLDRSLRLLVGSDFSSLLLDIGRAEDAFWLLDRVIRRLHGGGTRTPVQIAAMAYTLAKIAVHSGQPELAREATEWSVKQAHHPHDGRLAQSFLVLARALVQLEEPIEARRAIEALDRSIRSLEAMISGDPRIDFLRAEVLTLRALLLAQDEQHVDAEALHLDAVAVYRRILESLPNHQPTRRNLAGALVLAGQRDEAAPLIAQLLEEGFRRPDFMEMLRREGALPESLPPAIDFELELPAEMADALDKAGGLPLPWRAAELDPQEQKP